MGNEVKNLGGRPRGSGTGQQITARLRKEIYSALDITKKAGKPLDMLIADQLQQDAAGTINKLSRLLPQEVKLDGAGSEFALALADVATRIQEANRIIDAKPVHLSGEGKGEQVQDAVIIEESIDNLEPEADMVPKTKKKSGRPSRFAAEKSQDDA